MFRVLDVLSEVSGAPFVSLKIQVFSENLQNGSWCQIHLLGKNFLLTAMVSSDSGVHHIHHILCKQNTVSQLMDDHERRLSLYKVL